MTNPDSPIDVKETTSSRTASTVSFTWRLGAGDGGSPVRDFRITFDQSTGVYVVLAQGLIQTAYTATGLIAGNTYRFRVESRNSYGYSAHSTVVPILCATVPSIPKSPVSTLIASNVVFSWTPPSENGLPILGYKVYIRKSDNTFTTELASCDGSKA